MANTVMFIILAVFIIGSALMCVTTTKIMRAATFMLFVLFGVAGHHCFCLVAKPCLTLCDPQGL